MVFAAKLNEVPNWGKKVVKIGGQEVLLINVKGEIHACENECPHQGAPMAGAVLKDGDHISCPRHGYRFDLRTGHCQDFPQFTLKIFPVKIQGEDILVDVG